MNKVKFFRVQSWLPLPLPGRRLCLVCMTCAAPAPGTESGEWRSQSILIAWTNAWMCGCWDGWMMLLAWELAGNWRFPVRCAKTQGSPLSLHLQRPCLIIQFFTHQCCAWGVDRVAVYWVRPPAHPILQTEYFVVSCSALFIPQELLPSAIAEAVSMETVASVSMEKGPQNLEFSRL